MATTEKAEPQKGYIMKTEELTALGLTEEQVKQVFALHGKNLTAEQKKTEAAIAERDNLRQRLTEAEGALKSFEGIDPEKIQGELADWKKKAQDAEKDFKAQLTRRDQQDWLKSKLDEYGVKSPYARRQLEQECMAEGSGLAWKDGKFMGFDDFMKAAKEQDAGLYQTQEEKDAAEKAADEAKSAPAFTAPVGDQGAKQGRYVPPKIF